LVGKGSVNGGSIDLDFSADALYASYMDVLEEIVDVGLDNWSGQTNRGEPYQRKTWRWLRQLAQGAKFPTVVLGYGIDDRSQESVIYSRHIYQPLSILQGLGDITGKYGRYCGKKL
jgi:hypothetical protein